MLPLLAAIIDDSHLLAVVAACFGGGSAFCVWAWCQIKILSKMVRELEGMVAHLEAVFTVVKECPARVCPLETTIENMEARFNTRVEHRKTA